MSEYKNKFLTRAKGFTFFEVMVTVVILAVGIVGVYRAFLIALNYQNYLVTRLHLINFLTSETSRLENEVFAGKRISSRQEVRKAILPMASQSTIIAEAKSTSLTKRRKGPSALTLNVHWDQGDRSQDFSRSLLVYGNNEK